jgi:hypothetical protein
MSITRPGFFPSSLPCHQDTIIFELSPQFLVLLGPGIGAASMYRTHLVEWVTWLLVRSGSAPFQLGEPPELSPSLVFAHAPVSRPRIDFFVHLLHGLQTIDCDADCRENRDIMLWVNTLFRLHGPRKICGSYRL